MCETEAIANDQVVLLLDCTSNFSSFYVLKQLEMITNKNSSAYYSQICTAQQDLIRREIVIDVSSPLSKKMELGAFGKLGEKDMQQNFLRTEYSVEINSTIWMKEVSTFDDYLSGETRFMCIFLHEALYQFPLSDQPC